MGGGAARYRGGGGAGGVCSARLHAYWNTTLFVWRRVEAGRQKKRNEGWRTSIPRPSTVLPTADLVPSAVAYPPARRPSCRHSPVHGYQCRSIPPAPPMQSNNASPSLEARRQCTSGGLPHPAPLSRPVQHDWRGTVPPTHKSHELASTTTRHTVRSSRRQTGPLNVTPSPTG